jgi:UDP-glucose 4-epimerase
VAGRRVLITGVANPFGARLALRLSRDAKVERVVGVDTRAVDPEVAERIDLIQADLRDAKLGELVRASGADTVVHNDIVQFAEPGRPRAALHDVNVIGTLQLLTACAALPALRAIVVRSSAAIYGSEPDAPAFFTEDDARRYPLRTRFQRDVSELEGLVSAFARRHPAVVCTLLRLQPVVGHGLDTPVARLLGSPVVPTVLGFDPRVQLLDADDAVGAMRRAALDPVHGPVNVAADGVVSLSHALRHARRLSLPIATPLWGPLVGAARRAARQPPLPDEVARYLRYGRGVDTTRMRCDLDFEPRHTTLAAIERAVLAEAPPPPSTVTQGAEPP